MSEASNAQQANDNQSNDNGPPLLKRRKKGAKIAYVNAKAVLGKTALHLAAKRGYLEVGPFIV